MGPGGGWWVRGCWRLCCLTRGLGRAAEDGICSKVEVVEREGSPKLAPNDTKGAKLWGETKTRNRDRKEVTR